MKPLRAGRGRLSARAASAVATVVVSVAIALPQSTHAFENGQKMLESATSNDEMIVDGFMM